MGGQWHLNGPHARLRAEAKRSGPHSVRSVRGFTWRCPRQARLAADAEAGEGEGAASRADVAALAEESSAPSSGRAGPVAGWRVPSSRALNAAEERGRHAACPPAPPAARPTSPLLTRPQAAGPRRGRRWCRSSGTSGHGRQRWSGGQGCPLPVLSAQAPVRPLGASGPACPAPGRPLRARVPVVGAWPPPDPAVWAGHSGLRSPPCRRRLGRQPPSRGTLPGAMRTAARPPRPPRGRRIAQPVAPAGPRSGSPSRATVGDGLGDGVGPGGETAAGRRSLCFPDSALAGPPRVTPVGARCLRLKVKWQRAKVCCPPGPGDCWPRWRLEFRASCERSAVCPPNGPAEPRVGRLIGPQRERALSGGAGCPRPRVCRG